MIDDENKVIDEEIQPELKSGIEAGVHDVEVAHEVRSAFLDYAMSVIVSRAIPDVRDGFKPVHRRIVFGMNETGMTPDKPHKKSARIVGDVMGKYHPHGDSAIYSTLVRLAQPFSMRYTLVDGHGNFGSVDGDEAAAMRYTEARMTKLALEIVRDINQDTVDFVDNYDGSEKEPEVLPSRFPNLLVNGSSGIAVGMATNMPPHNLTETINAIKLIAVNPDITPKEIMEQALFGPDFPTGAMILGKKGILDAYETGRGSVIIRSKAHFEELSNGKTRIIIDEIPYQVNKARLIESIADLVRNKIVDGITDIRDESNKEGIRVVIELRRDVIPEVILNNLYKQTQLQTSFGIINLCLVDKAPQVLNIKQLLGHYLNFQVDIIRRRTQHQLAVAEARDHIVIGLIKANENIDEIVQIIKASANTEEATSRLIERFGFTEIQTKEVLSMTLRRLTGLEKEKLLQEREQLEINIAKYRLILSSRENMVDVVLTELDEIKNKFGDERRTEISNQEANIDDESLIPEEEIIVSITKKGYVKRMSPDEFRTQKRGGKGVKGMKTNEDDLVDTLVHTKTHTDILFFTNSGKVYRIRGHQIPEQQRTGKGMPIVNLLNLDKEETVRAILSVDHYDAGTFLFYVTRLGVVKRTSLEEFSRINQNGKIAINLRDGDQLIDVKVTNGEALIGIAASNGKMVKFNEDDVRSMGRTAAGVKGINLDEGDFVVGVTTSLEGELILALTSRGYGKMSAAEDYRLTKRGSKGVATIKASEKVGSLVGIRAVKGDEDLFLITEAGTVIRISLEQVSVLGRNTQGVKVINLKKNETLSSFAVVEHGEDEECDDSVEGEEQTKEEVE
ncbi:MAG TPA: DNA gyrase subunit A [Bacilli bacterium]|nr:DNA gyrase subunit A [Bacilli bacterium]